MISFDHRDTSKSTGLHPWYEQTIDIMPEADIEIVSLALGDVTWSGRNEQLHLMEIKHTGDLIRSFGDRHIQDQIERMVVESEETGTIMHLLIAGQLSATHEGFTSTGLEDKPWQYPYAIWPSYLNSVQGLGITVHRCDIDDFGRAFSSIYKSTLKKNYRRTRPRRKIVLVSKQAQALSALAPSIPISVLESAIQDRGFSWFFYDDIGVEDYASIKGIGPIGANQLYDEVNRTTT
tara:strand:- start:662 stop:1366 length:705 start_codon:yes stop_codon:yes gene_type:complete